MSAINALEGGVPLMQLTRSMGAQSTTECIHMGSIAHVNAAGQVLGHVGNPHMMSFTRSAIKALQALPFAAAGGPEQLGYTQAETALLCASHNGEEVHAQAAGSMLAKAGETYRALECGCHVPGIFSYLDAAPPPGLVFDERHHNCSGKHSGMVGMCRVSNWPVAGYTAPEHPLQRAIAQAVASGTGVPEHALRQGVDGCNAPNFAMPLSGLATAYARMAASCAGQDVHPFSPAMATLGRAMAAHPYMVAGEQRHDTAFMQIGAGDLITKVGADGVQVVASISRGEAFALKIADGNKTATCAAAVHVLRQLGWLSPEQSAALEPWASGEIRNARGLAVGAREPVWVWGTPTA